VEKVKPETKPEEEEDKNQGKVSGCFRGGKRMSFERTFLEEQAKKYDVKLESSLRDWIASVFSSAGDVITPPIVLDKTRPFRDLLKDGEILCR